MESLLSNFDIEDKKNFWKLYPSFKTPKACNKLFKSDKSTNKDKSSDIMWAIIHIYDKHEANPYRMMDSTEKIEVVGLDLLDDENFDWSKYSEIEELFSKILQTEEERELESFKDFMAKRRKLISDSEATMNLESLSQLDGARKRNKENLAELQRLTDLVELKSDGGLLKGGIIESAKEKGLL